MKLIIDMPEETLREVNRCGLFLCPRDKERLINSIKHNTPIPDNATNGDVIKAVFPNAEYKHIHKLSGMDYTEVKGLNAFNFTIEFYDEWWNAPYKRGGTE